MKLRGQSALVTGASTGIGRAIALALAREGARVALTARSMTGLSTTKAEIEAIGGNAYVVQADLTNREDIKRLGNMVNEWGDISILVHAAGVWHSDSAVYAGMPLVETPQECIDEVLDVGIRAPMQLTRQILPGMIRAKRGKVLAISGTFGSGGAGWLHYYVSKLALEHFVVGLAQELRPYEIQVNCVSPADTDTEALRRFFPEDAKTAVSAEEVAKIALFLVSGDADHVSGQKLEVRNKRVV